MCTFCVLYLSVTTLALNINAYAMISSYTLRTRIANSIRLRFFDSLHCKHHAHLVREYKVEQAKQTRWGKKTIFVSDAERSLSPFSQFDEDLSFVEPLQFRSANAAETLEPSHTTDFSHKTIVLLHGFPGLWWSWKYQIGPLAQAGYRVIAIDLRGFGGSECPANPASYDVFRAANDVLYLLRSMGIAKASLVGHGIGGEIAHFIALYAPNYVDALVGLNYVYTVQGSRQTMAHRQNAAGSRFDFVLSHAESAIELDYEKRSELLFRRLFSQGGTSCDTPDVLSPYKHASNSIVDRLGDPLCLPHYFDEVDLQYYLENYKATGFSGPVSFIRNRDANSQRFLSLKSHVVTQPTLLMAGGSDPLADARIYPIKPGYRSLNFIDIEEGGPFLQLQKSDTVNDNIVRFLRTIDCPC